MYVSLLFSFASVLKSSYNLQAVNIFEWGLASPMSSWIFNITSLTWLASILIFRGGSIAVTCVYIGHHFNATSESYGNFIAEGGEGNLFMIIAIFGMIFVVVLINMWLKWLFQKQGALLSGAMSIVSPAKYLCGEKSDLKDCETRTKRYLFSYCLFNVVFMYLLFLVLVIYDDGAHEFFTNCRKEEHVVGKSVFLPKLTIFCIASVCLTFVQWYFSLKPIFASKAKHPRYQECVERKNTFPETFPFSESFARSGFFYFMKVQESIILRCYDCGLEIYQMHWDMMRDYALNDVNIMHAANLLRYKAQYKSFFFGAQLKQKFGRKETVFDLYARSISVNPECRALASFEIDFKNIADRRKSFFGDASRFIYGKEFDLEDLVESGFVKTSTASLTCFSCLMTIRWSPQQCMDAYSPWSLHAEFGSQLGVPKCLHLKRCLVDAKYRMLTFPKEFRTLDTGRGAVHKCKAYADAGFYVRIWNKDEGLAIIRCFEDCGATHKIYSQVSIASSR